MGDANPYDDIPIDPDANPYDDIPIDPGPNPYDEIPVNDAPSGMEDDAPPVATPVRLGACRGQGEFLRAGRERT